LVIKQKEKTGVEEIIEELQNEKITDIGVTFRTRNGEVCNRWVGDSLAVKTMAETLVFDILGDICPEEK
jgi:N-acetyl-gamma-glutamylphosphate reductase